MALPELPQRLRQDLYRGIQEQGRHQAGDNQVRPCGCGTPDPEGCKHHRHIADGIVARAQPDGANIRIAILVADEQKHAGQN